MKKFNVLVFPGGTEVGLEIYRSLVVKKNVHLHSLSDASVNHASCVYENHAVVSNVNGANLLDELKQWLNHWDIDVIVPAHPLVIDFLDKNRDSLDVEIVLADTNCLVISRSKRKTYECLSEFVQVPETYIAENIRFPAFVKPDAMYGAQGVRLVTCPSELKETDFDEQFLISEYLPGDEITVDCFSNKNGDLLFCSARSRERVRMGTSLHSRKLIELDSFVRNIANEILKKMNLWGPWFFQMKRDIHGNFKLLEVEARIAGTMALHRVTGINFAYLGILECFDIPYTVEAISLPISLDRCLKSVYDIDLKYDTVYLDLDDTIVIKDRLNTQIVQFMVQCLNNGIKLVLISKNNSHDPDRYLDSLRIRQFFDEIIWLEESQSKADYISDKSAIFIDDSFSQRMAVGAACNIPTFDPSMVEMLVLEKRS